MTSAPIDAALLPDTARVLADDVEVGGVSLRALAARARDAAVRLRRGARCARGRRGRARVRRRRRVRLQGLPLRGDGPAGRRGGAVHRRRDGRRARPRAARRGAGEPADRPRQQQVGTTSSAAPSPRASTASSWTTSTRSTAGATRPGGARPSPLGCLVRVTPGVEAHTHEYVRTGQEDTKFGFSIASGDARAAIARCARSPAWPCTACTPTSGSQVFDDRAHREAVAILGRASPRGDGFDELCVGGGLGVAYVEGESAPTITQWARAVRESARAAGLAPGVRDPGRAGARDRGPGGADPLHRRARSRSWPRAPTSPSTAG